MKSILRKILPPPVKRHLRRMFEWGEAASVQVFSMHRLLACIYYGLFNRRFEQEHLAVLKGRAAYYRSLRIMKDSSPLLRRNVHRLEKGLIMRPRHDVFAEGFILETVNVFNRAKNQPDYSKNELRWAKDVLDEYFDVVKDTPTIRKARQLYRADVDTSNEVPWNSVDRIFKPYSLANAPKASITFDQLKTLFLQRRSVRWYKPQQVPYEKIKKAINAAALAPSACNRQPFRFIVVNKSSEASKIAEYAMGTSGFAHQLPAIIVVVGDLSAYPYEHDRHLIYIDASLASMQLMLAAETLGLSTCPINWPDIDHSEKQLRLLLGLLGHERIIMLISIGFGDLEGGIPFSQKKQDGLITQSFPRE